MDTLASILTPNSPSRPDNPIHTPPAVLHRQTAPGMGPGERVYARQPNWELMADLHSECMGIRMHPQSKVGCSAYFVEFGECRDGIV